MYEEYLNEIGTDQDGYERFLNLVVDNNISLSQIGCLATDFHSWQKRGYIDFSEFKNKSATKRMKVKLNFIDAVWIRFLMKMKDFGIESTKWNEACQYLLQDFTPEINNITKNQLKKMGLNSTNPEEVEVINELIKNMDEDHEFLKKFMPDVSLPKFTLFSVFVNLVIVKNEDFKLLLAPGENGKLRVTEYHEKFTDSETLEILNSSHLSISLYELVSDLMTNDKIEKQLATHQIFQNQDLAIFELIRKKEVKEITITKLDSEVIEIKITEEKDIKNDDLIKVKQALGFKSCKELSLKMRNDKHMILRKTSSNKMELKTQ